MSTTTVRVRTATGDDAGAVADLFAGYVRQSIATFVEEPPTAEHWAGRIDDAAARGLPFLVGVDDEGADGAIAGFAFAAAYRPHAAYRHTVEDSVYIAPGSAGRGIGTRLLTALIEALERTTIRQVVAVIAAGHGSRHETPSMVLHRRLGFEVVGRLPAVGYKHDTWADTVLMQKDLRPT